MLIGAARAALDDATSKKPGWFYSELVAITMSALSIEAMSNAIGERVIPDWKDFESASPIAKLRLLCKQLQVPFDKNVEPWASAIWLAKFRNLVAHAKPELVQEERVISRAEYDNRPHDSPKSKLEKKISTEHAERAVRTAESIKDLLCKNIPPEEAFGLYSDSWSGSASLHDNN